MRESESEVAQSCLIPSDPMDCSPPGSSVHGIFQARVLEWGAIAFSGITTAEAINFIRLNLCFTYFFKLRMLLWNEIHRLVLHMWYIIWLGIEFWFGDD